MQQEKRNFSTGSGTGVSPEQAKKIMASPEFQQLVAQLQQAGGNTLQRAAVAAKAGDMAQAQQILAPALSNEKTAQLLNQLNRRKDKYG